MEMQKSEYIILYGGKWCTNPILIWNLGTNPNLLLQNGIEGCYWLQNSLHFLRRHPKSYFNLHRHGIRVLDHKSVGIQGSVDLESNLDYRFELELRLPFPSITKRGRPTYTSSSAILPLTYQGLNMIPTVPYVRKKRKDWWFGFLIWYVLSVCFWDDIFGRIQSRI